MCENPRLIILNYKQVLALVGNRSKSWLYDAIKKGQFPKPIHLTKRAVGWRLSDIEKWIESRPQG